MSRRAAGRRRRWRPSHQEVLGIGQPRVVLDRGVDIVVVQAAAAAAAVGAPAAGVRNLVDLLHVDVHQRARLEAFIADGVSSCSDRSPVSGSRSASRGTRWRCSTQVTVRAATSNASVISPPTPRGHLLGHDPGLDCGRCATGAACGSDERSAKAGLPPTSNSFIHRCAHCRDPQLLGHMSDRLTIDTNPTNQQPTGIHHQPRISVNTRASWP